MRIATPERERGRETESMRVIEEEEELQTMEILAVI